MWARVAFFKLFEGLPGRVSSSSGQPRVGMNYYLRVIDPKEEGMSLIPLSGIAQGFTYEAREIFSGLEEDLATSSGMK